MQLQGIKSDEEQAKMPSEMERELAKHFSLDGKMMR